MVMAAVKPAAVLASPDVHVEWENDLTAWLLPFTVILDNIWFFATRTVPMFDAIRRNASSVDYDWHNNFRQALLGFDGRVEYSDGEWWSQLSSTNVRCFRRAVATGPMAYVVRA
jgi:hypothetical protein